MNGVVEALKRLLDAVAGAGDDLTREDVIARCVQAVLELRSFGGRRDVFPARTEIVVSVPPNFVEIARVYVADPAFDREVAGRVKNELANPRALPVRSYRVEEGARFAAVATVAAVEAEGQRVTCGRAHENPPATLIALKGATGRINSRQVWIELSSGKVSVGRISDANPVEVEGREVQPGGHIQVARLPVAITLSLGEMTLRVEG